MIQEEWDRILLWLREEKSYKSLKSSYSSKPGLIKSKLKDMFKEVETIESILYLVETLQISQDCTQIVVAGKDHSIRILKRGLPSNNGFVESLQLLGHTDSIKCIQYNGNFDKIVSGSADQTIRIWTKSRLETYTCTSILKNHTKQIIDIKLSENDQMIVSCSKDYTIKIWRWIDEFKDYSEIQQLVCSSMLICIQLSKDMETIYGGTYNKTINIWKMNNIHGAFESFQILNGHSGSIKAIQISDDSRTLVSCSVDKSINIWRASNDTAEYSIHQSLTGHSNIVTTIQLSLDQNMIISGSNDESIKIWKHDHEEDKYVEVESLDKQKEAVSLVRLAQDKQYLFSAADFQPINIWKLNLESGLYKESAIIFEHNDDINCVEVTQDASIAFAGIDDGTIQVFKVDLVDGEMKESQVLNEHNLSITSLFLTRNKLYLVSTSQDKTAILWRYTRLTDSYEKYQILREHEAGVTTGCITEEGSIIVTGGEDRKIRVWRRNRISGDFSIDQTLESHSHIITVIKMSDNADKLISGSRDSTIRVWLLDRKSKQYLEHQILKDHKGYVNDLEISVKGQILVSCSQDFTIKVFRLNNISQEFRKIQTLRGHNNSVQALKISRNNEAIVSASTDETIKVWRLHPKTGFFHLIQTLKGHTDFVTDVVVSESLGMILSSSSDCTVRVWTLNDSFFKESDILAHCIPQIVFHEVKGFKFRKENIKRLIDYLFPEFQEYTNHGSLHLLYLVVLAGFEDLLLESLVKFGYKPWYYSHEFDPILLALNVDDYRILNSFAKFFTDHPNEIFIMNEEIFIKGLKCSSGFFRQLTVQRFLVPGISIADLKSSVAGSQNSFSLAISSPGFHKDDLFVKRLELESLKESRSTSKVRVKYLTTSFKFDISVSSIFMIQFLDTMEHCEDEVLMSDVKGLVKFLWRRNKIYLTLYSMLYWTYAFLNYIAIIWCRSTQDCEIFLGSERLADIVKKVTRFSLLFIYVLLLAYEFIVFSRRGNKYFKGVYNWIDMVTYASFIPISLLIFSEDGYDTSRFWNFLITIYLLLLGLRTIIHLRVIDGVRYLIAMLMNVFLDMRYFLGVFTVGILIFGAIETEISKAEGDFSPEFHSYFLLVDSIYGVGFGDLQGERGSFKWNRYFYFILETVLIPLILFNLLIAIISRTFEDFKTNQELTDMREMLELLIDLGSFKSVIIWRETTDKMRRFLHLVLPLEDSKLDLIDLTERVERVENKIEIHNKSIKDSLDTLARQQLSLETNLRRMEDNLKFSIEGKLARRRASGTSAMVDFRERMIAYGDEESENDGNLNVGGLSKLFNAFGNK